MDTTRKDGYNEKEWIQRERLDTRRSNGYNEKEWRMNLVRGWMDGWVMDSRKNSYKENKWQRNKEGKKKTWSKDSLWLHTYIHTYIYICVCVYAYIACCNAWMFRTERIILDNIGLMIDWIVRTFRYWHIHT